MTTTFGYPGGASLEIHQALTRSESIRNILCRHEQVRKKKRRETKKKEGSQGER